jgi:hypothetical protein
MRLPSRFDRKFLLEVQTRTDIAAETILCTPPIWRRMILTADVAAKAATIFSLTKEEAAKLVLSNSSRFLRESEINRPQDEIAWRLEKN